MTEAGLNVKELMEVVAEAEAELLAVVPELLEVEIELIAILLVLKVVEENHLPSYLYS